MVFFLVLATSLVVLWCPSTTASPSGSCTRTDEGYGCTHGPSTRHCWDGEFSIHTDVDHQWPHTGKIVEYEWEISNMTLAPDGVAKEMMVINGQFPGPTIYADWGDTIRVSVKNNLPSNGTGIHWHGVRQFKSNHMDGVGGITECPIANGETRIYEFNATQYGSSWYHSHYSVQYSDGLLGGIVIRGPATAQYDIDLGPLPFMDWFYDSIFTVNAAALHSTGPPLANNLLINGTMTSQSGGNYATTTLQPGKKHLLRLMNTGINNYVHVSLDGHEFEVIAADFIPIVPFKTDSLVMAVGQRYDVIIEADQPIDNYWLRVTTGGGKCDGPNANAANLRAVFHYDGAGDHSPNSTGIEMPTGCYDEIDLTPFHKMDVPEDTPEDLKVGFTNTASADGLVQWLINGAAMKVDLRRPTLQKVFDANHTFLANETVYSIDSSKPWSYWVVQQDNSSLAAAIPHPVHLHGHDFYVLDWAENTTWTGDISYLKFDNPIRRDTATLPGRGYLVLAFEADNPGAWLMHCHIPFHVSGGLALQFLSRRNEIEDSIANRSMFDNGCKSWRFHQDMHFPHGFTNGDSLLRKRR